jgi:hypothetical protein
VFASGDRDVRRRSLYSGTGAARLSWLLRWFAVGAAVLFAFAVAGCSYSLSSLISKDDSDVTGSIGRSADRPGRAADTAQPPEVDLAYARAVAADALTRGGKDSSTPWENPHTGAGGNITPLASSYSEGGFTCRDFLASYVHGTSEAWLQGEACRTDHGNWEVKSLTPLKHG